MTERLPWEVVETLPGTDASLVASWDDRLDAASTPAQRARALVGSALARYWSVSAGLADDADTVAADLTQRIDEAEALARELNEPELLAEVLLGRLHACWRPSTLTMRQLAVEELTALAPAIDDEELCLRIHEWVVVCHFDHGRLDDARREVESFARRTAATGLVLFRRREELWRGNLAMLEGRLDDAVRINQDAISATADVSGSPFSFQNVAITVAIERYLRRGLADVVDAVRSIRASSPRVAANWDAGLAFTLSEVDELDEARTIFERLAADRFAAVERDLNWLVTMQLLGLVARTLDDRARCAVVLELLTPFAHLDGTHGSGYASYGPVGRITGALAGHLGQTDRARRDLDRVLATRAPGPWTALTRLERARVTASASPSSALADAIDAARQLREYDMERWAVESDRVALDLRLAGHGAPVAVRGDGLWILARAGSRVEVPDGVGVRHLVALLRQPGASVHVTELEPSPTIGPTRTDSDIRTLDDDARRAYRQRLDELDARRDPTRAERDEAELLRRELRGGAHVRSSSAEMEKLRVRITKSLRRTIDVVGTVDAALGEHLASAVSTGRRCMYAPTDGVAWTVIDRRRLQP